MQRDSNQQPLSSQTNEHSTIWPNWAKWLSVRLGTKWLWSWVPLQSLTYTQGCYNFINVHICIHKHFCNQYAINANWLRFDDPFSTNKGFTHCHVKNINNNMKNELTPSQKKKNFWWQSNVINFIIIIFFIQNAIQRLSKLINNWSM